jgi:curved DNA-binding protein CbpA
MAKKYCQILEIEENATSEQIKQAYRRLSLIHHPDKGGQGDKFKEISEAYSVLSNPENRGEYDNENADILQESLFSDLNLSRKNIYNLLSDLLSDYETNNSELDEMDLDIISCQICYDFRYDLRKHIFTCLDSEAKIDYFFENYFNIIKYYSS